MIYEFHKVDPDNVGDYYCNPSRYFDIPDVVTKNLTKHNVNVENKIIVVGGGGLIHNTFDQHIDRLLAQRPRLSAAWSIGHNYGAAVTNKGKSFLFPEYLKQFNLLSVRDWIKGHENLYVPCVSCMHPSFDKGYKARHPIVFYLHAAKTPEHLFPESLPTKTNADNNIKSVIKFLASGETIVTNSYHGAYWGLLLGRRVISTAWSIKFNYFKYPPTLIDNLADWDDYYGTAAEPGYLEESRHLNREFYKKFLAAI